MAIPHHLVVERWAKDTPKLSRRGSHIYAIEDTIYSYGSHFPMAIRDDERKLFIVNGDRYSSSTTQHQSLVRSTITQTGWPSINVPFSCLNAANVALRSLTLIETGKEIERWGCHTCNIAFDVKNYGTYYDERTHEHEHHKTWYRHLLAPSLVTAKRAGHPRYFLSGFDETARAWNGGYFLSELPKRVNTIADAFESLRPKAVLKADAEGIEVKRQGDIFAIPYPELTTRRLSARGKRLPEYHIEEKVVLDWFNVPFYTEHIVTDYLEEPDSARNIRNGLRPRLLKTNHFATEAFAVKRGKNTEIYARGVLYHMPNWREADHKQIILGKVWHKIYRNTALGSWSVTGRVD